MPPRQSRLSFAGSSYSVANAGGGDDDHRVPELATEATDGDGHSVGEGIGILVPDRLEQVLGTEVSGGGSEQGLEKGELLDRQVQSSPVPGWGAAERIKLDAGEPQGPGPDGRLAADQGLQPEDQFREVEGLGQVYSR